MLDGFSAKEVARLRADTPAAGRYAHFAHGSASLPPTPVFAALQDWIDTERRLGSHRAADHHAEGLAEVKSSVGQLVNAQPYQIALLDSASRAWSNAMSGMLNAGRPVHIITTDLEYGANAIYLLLASRRRGLTFSVLPVRRAKVPLLQQVTEALDAVPSQSTPVISLASVSTAWGVEIVCGEIGSAIARMVQDRNGFFFLDASHAVGQLPVDMQKLGCDAMVFPARKWLRGPKGVGVLCLSDRALAGFGSIDATDVAAARWSRPLQAQAHSDARRFEGYEFNPGLRLALKAACDYAATLGPVRIKAQNQIVRSAVEKALDHRFGWRSLEDGTDRATALMTYPLPYGDASAGEIVRHLWGAGVNVSMVTSQHALWALHSVGAPALMRLTPHYITDESEIERLLAALEGAMLRTPLHGQNESL